MMDEGKLVVGDFSLSRRRKLLLFSPFFISKLDSVVYKFSRLSSSDWIHGEETSIR